MKMIVPSENRTYDIHLNENMHETNAGLADENRALLDRHGVVAVDILGSVGSGKTTLCQQIIGRLKGRMRIATIAGDLVTTIDADRIRSAGSEVIQINTAGGCHLDAHTVRQAINRLDLPNLDLLLVENVGNLICPAEFPVGAHQRLVVVSTTEGPYMVVKHPYILLDATVLVVNKIDMAEAMQVDPERLRQDALAVKPALKTVLTSARSGIGVDDVIRALGLAAV
jgi:hydrogenase nickel incorporation protein HypB